MVVYLRGEKKAAECGDSAAHQSKTDGGRDPACERSQL